MPQNGEQRRAERLQRDLLVSCRTPRGYVSHWAANLSRHGIFVDTPNPAPVGSRVELVVHLPDRLLPCRLDGRVVRVVGQGRRRGMGVEFVGALDRSAARIDSLVKTLRPKSAPNAGGHEDVAPA
jgi:uncharacterized protein (TIGR02266 family)